MESVVTARTRVLFVAHDAYRAGATIFLLNMLRWLKQNSRIEFEVALRDDGEMVQHFAALAPTHVLAPAAGAAGWRHRLRQQVRGLVTPKARPRRGLAALLAQGRFDVLYLNTITLGDQLEALGPLSLPVITHVHELPSAVRRYARGKAAVVVASSARLICVSEAVRDSLVASFSAAGAKAQLIYGFVPFRAALSEGKAALRQRLTEPLGIEPSAWVVGLCGYGDLRKGIDLLVPLATMLPTQVDGRPLHLVWVGAQAPEYPADLARDDATRAGVDGRVHFPGVTSKPLDWTACFDAHLLLSREDPFPLVIMEAAALNVPTIAFADAGGAIEFTSKDAGLCVPYLNLAAMADELCRLLSDPDRLAAYGRIARQRVHDRHSPDVVLPQVVQVIEQVSGGVFGSPVA